MESSMTTHLEGSIFNLLAASRNLNKQNDEPKFQKYIALCADNKVLIARSCISHFWRWLSCCHFIAGNNDREGFFPSYRRERWAQKLIAKQITNTLFSHRQRNIGSSFKQTCLFDERFFFQCLPLENLKPMPLAHYDPSNG